MSEEKESTNDNEEWIDESELTADEKKAITIATKDAGIDIDDTLDTVHVENNSTTYHVRYMTKKAFMIMLLM